MVEIPRAATLRSDLFNSYKEKVHKLHKSTKIE